jgi:hypothetical protein
MSEQQILTIGELARWFGVSPQQMTGWSKRRGFPERTSPRIPGRSTPPTFDVVQVTEWLRSERLLAGLLRDGQP